MWQERLSSLIYLRDKMEILNTSDLPDAVAQRHDELYPVLTYMILNILEDEDASIGLGALTTAYCNVLLNVLSVSASYEYVSRVTPVMKNTVELMSAGEFEEYD